jgi:hypothetical protein
MAQATLERIMQELKTLGPDELREIERAARSLLGPAGSTEEGQFLQSLQDSGLLNEIKRPTGTVASNRPLVSIQGKGLSDTIIEERR